MDADSLSDMDGLRCAAGVAVAPVSHDRWKAKLQRVPSIMTMFDSIAW